MCQSGSNFANHITIKHKHYCFIVAAIYNVVMKKRISALSAAGLATIFFAGGSLAYMAWQNFSKTSTQRPPEAANAMMTERYIDSARKFTFKYPAGWVVDHPDTQTLEGPAVPTPDWTRESRPLFIKPASGHTGNNVEITTSCQTIGSDGKTKSIIQGLKDRKDRFHTQQDQKMNGFDVLYDRLDFQGDAESYLDHTYALVRGSTCLTVHFRESWHHPMGGTSFDDGKNMPGFLTILGSIRYLD
jgi:hypothetical protein